MDFNLDQHLRLVFISGKGGVGKTTLSCGFARQWAKANPGQRVLLLSTDPAHSLGDVLQMTVENTPHVLSDVENLQVQALDAKQLLQDFKTRYGEVLQRLVERGSFVEGEDLTPVWDLDWPGIDELMGLLEIQRLLRDHEVERVVVDMAPSGHALNLLGLMDFLETLLESLELFQEKHRTISRSFTGRYQEDDTDTTLAQMKSDLAAGRQLLENHQESACVLVAIPEPMSYWETQRFVTALQKLNMKLGGIWVNRIIPDTGDADRYQEQQEQLRYFLELAGDQPVFIAPQWPGEPLGPQALDDLTQAMTQLTEIRHPGTPITVQWPAPILPSLPDLLAEGRRLIIIGGKGGVGKTTVAAAIGYGISQQHPGTPIRLISIDPAHSLGDAFGITLSHQPQAIINDLSGQEIDADQVLDQFREDYLWELADMISGDHSQEISQLQLAYGPEGWRRIVAQSLPGIDEMLSLVEIIDQLEQAKQTCIILDTAPTGHLLRFLEMPTALSDWLAWIFKLWIKYQDVLGRTDFMGRLRTLRQRVIAAQKKLKDPNYTEFIAVIQAETAILAEAQRLVTSINTQGIHQRYVIHNRAQADQTIDSHWFPQQTLIHLPNLPRSVTPLTRIQGAAQLLFNLDPLEG